MFAIIMDIKMFLRTLAYNIFGRCGSFIFMCVPGGSRLINFITKAKSFLMKLEYRKNIINSENRKLLGPQKYEKLHILLSAI